MKFCKKENKIDVKDYITGNKFIKLCDKYNITFCKTDNVLSGLLELKSRTDNPKIFVTHQSDYSIIDAYTEYLPKGVTWFAENCEVVDNSNIIGIPNGLNNMEMVISQASKFGAYSSCFSHLADFHNNLNMQWNNLRDYKNLVYMNFTPDTSFSERTYVYKMFQDKKFVTKENSVSHNKFAESVYNHNFVLSPRGNGYDCVRTWETIYLGSIPIIKKNNVMSHFLELPILFVDEWEQVTESLLLKTLEEFSCRDFDMSKAKISYWDSVFAKYV